MKANNKTKSKYNQNELTRWWTGAKRKPETKEKEILRLECEQRVKAFLSGRQTQNI